MYRTLTLSLCLLASAAATAVAQPAPPMERRGDVMDARRSQAQARDDRRDLQRFQTTLAAFDDAMRRRDPMGVRNALQSFVQQGRSEVAEQRRESVQAEREAGRSAAEVMRTPPGPGRRDDRRDVRDDRRDARQERRELQQEEAALAELERAAQAEAVFGPKGRVLISARQAMVRFVELARVELQRSRTEVREDRRELREDRRGLPPGPPPPAPFVR